MSRLTHIASIVVTLACISFIICAFCFIYTEKLRANYRDTLSGYGNENCSTVGYNVKRSLRSSSSYSGTCRVYAFDQCSLKQVSRELTSTRIDCNDPLIQSYMDRSPIGSEHLYFYFNRRPDRYYTQQQYTDFIEDYSRNPIVDILVLSGFTGASVLAIIVSTSYLFLRDVSCKQEETVTVRVVPTHSEYNVNLRRSKSVNVKSESEEESEESEEESEESEEESEEGSGEQPMPQGE